MALIRNNRTTKIFCSFGIVFLIISICIFFPYYFINYKNSETDKQNLIETTCKILNQTYEYKYSCNKNFYQCNCNVRYYYPCDMLLNQHIQNYCCDPICYKNTSLNSLNYITCGNDTIITSIIQNKNNVTNTFIKTCKFDDKSCVDYWTNLKQNIFECYYESNDKNTILLNKPEFVELYSIGFIFTYICIGISIIFFILGLLYYKKHSDYMVLN